MPWLVAMSANMVTDRRKVFVAIISVLVFACPVAYFLTQRLRTQKGKTTAPGKPSVVIPAPTEGSSLLVYQGFVNYKGLLRIKKTDRTGSKLVDSEYEVGADGEWFDLIEKNVKGPIKISVGRRGYLRDVKYLKISDQLPKGEMWHIYPGDVDGNDVIDTTDVKIVAFFARPSLPTDHEFARQLSLPKTLQHIDETVCDLDLNGKVDLQDIEAVIANLGKRMKEPELVGSVTN